VLKLPHLCSSSNAERQGKEFHHVIHTTTTTTTAAAAAAAAATAARTLFSHLKTWNNKYYKKLLIF
jgi:hypothetical protein